MVPKSRAVYEKGVKDCSRERGRIKTVWPKKKRVVLGKAKRNIDEVVEGTGVGKWKVRFEKGGGVKEKKGEKTQLKSGSQANWRENAQSF